MVGCLAVRNQVLEHLRMLRAASSRSDSLEVVSDPKVVVIEHFQCSHPEVVAVEAVVIEATGFDRHGSVTQMTEGCLRGPRILRCSC